MRHPHAPPSPSGFKTSRRQLILMMRVEADGRQPFQVVYMWANEENKQETGHTKTTNRQYKPETDGPHVVPCPQLPTGAELVQDDKSTKAYMEVGLIIGSNPTNLVPTGLPRAKGRAQARAHRGILRRDEGAMRVFIPMTQHVASQAKYYVGCRLTNGHLSPRVIDNACIFFYPEF
ncbi:hypothetical protein ACHAPT_013573 [Fusarium lateritium]